MGSPPLNEKKRVTFNPFVAVRSIIPFKDADLWYRKPDYQAMKTEVKRTVYHYKKKRNGRVTEKGGLCIRGLEDHLVKNPQVLQERRMKTSLIVLLEHDRQLEEDGNAPNEEKLADCLKGISRISAVRARRRALHDEAAVTRGRNQGNEAALLLAPTQPSPHSCKISHDTNEIVQKNVAHGTSISMLATINTHFSARLNILRLRELSQESPRREPTSSRFFLPGSPPSRSATAKLVFCSPSPRSPFL